MDSVKAGLFSVPFLGVGVLLIASVWLAPLGLLIIVIGLQPFWKARRVADEKFSADYRAVRKNLKEGRYPDEPIPEWVKSGLEPNDNVVPINKNLSPKDEYDRHFRK